MAENIRTIIRGDSYGVRRPLYEHTLVDEDNDDLIPFSLKGCTVRTTFRAAPASVTEDPTDSTAIWKGTLSVDSAGVVTLSNGIVLAGTADDGQVEIHLSAEASRAFPAGVPLISDLEVTDALGEKFTFLFDEKIVAVDGVTHRLVG